MHEARFILLESNVLRESILAHHGKGEGLGNSIPSQTSFFFKFIQNGVDFIALVKSLDEKFLLKS